MMENMLERKGEGLKDKIALVSGSGNVAQYTVEKIHQIGGKAVTMSDTSGFIFDPDGINTEKLEFVKQLKIEKRLYEIMKDIHNKCVQYGTEGDDINYRKGANIAGFVKVADAMVACGNI